MALTEPNRQNSSATHYSVKHESDLDYKSVTEINPQISAPRRAMPPDLKFQENSSLLQGEDVERFFENLEGSEHEPQHKFIKREVDTIGSPSAKEMFQNAMHAMPVQGTAPTYHDTPGAITSVHSGSNPLYVPTTRAVLPPVHYLNGTTGQGATTPSSPAMWQLQPETSYSSTSAHAHSSVSPRFGFAPAPSSPTGRTDSSSFTTPLARSSGLNPYSYTDFSPWMALQPGLRQTGTGKFSYTVNTP